MRSDGSTTNSRLSDLDRALATRIREARISKGLTQSALADEIGVTYQQYQKYESGQNRITAARLFRLARALDLPISRFFSLDERGRAPPAVDQDDCLIVAACRSLPPEFVKAFRDLVTVMARSG
ncbi:helix-turn-helix domain-containing protein [Antarcticirhabdus aurantiaca]|uniref:Helix-turn-helix transcriptional regulator n=1 Tax=Antarcticirhabdus aurantiaca TaxID=2606717 RepID=A0ACD4NJ30_9HYPH|nr:helix-turn-helix transcriptional regulator [Jeongeuplla avenae]